jgi:Divergent InlB B-repeat domain
MSRRWLALLAALLSLAVALGGVSAANAVRHHKHHKVCYRGTGRHRHKVTCPKPKRKKPAGCVVGNLPAAPGRVFLVVGAGSGGAARVFGHIVHDTSRTFTCARGTAVNVTAIPDGGYQFFRWSATDNGHKLATCSGSSTVCRLTLVNHGPQPSDTYTLSATFCPAGPPPTPEGC